MGGGKPANRKMEAVELRIYRRLLEQLPIMVSLIHRPHVIFHMPRNKASGR